MPFSSTITSLHLKIIQNLLGCPSNPQVLKRICEFLVAVHPTYETLVIHAPGNLYFAPIVKLKGKCRILDMYLVCLASSSKISVCMLICAGASCSKLEG